MLVRADDRGVNRDVPVDRARLVGRGLDLLEQTFPGSVARPQAMALVDGYSRAEPFGQITPLHSGPHPVQNPIDHLPVISPPATTPVTDRQDGPSRSDSASVRSPRPMSTSTTQARTSHMIGRTAPSAPSVVGSYLWLLTRTRA
jgi:hypothetical protein